MSEQMQDAPATPIEELQANVAAEIAELQKTAAATSENALDATPVPGAAITTGADAAPPQEGDKPPTPAAAAEKDAGGAQPEPSDDIDPVLLAAAKRAQCSDEELDTILAFGPEKARVVLAGYKRVEDNYSRELSRTGNAELERRKKEQDGATTQAPATPSDAQKPATATAQSGAALSDYGIDEDLLDPAVVTPMKKLIGDMTALRAETDKAMKYISDQKKAAEQATNEGSQARAFELVDGFLAPLLKHQVYADAYGTGKTAEMAQDRNSAQAQARLKLLTEAENIFLGATQKGRDITADEALERALSIQWQDELPKKATAIARGEVASQLNGRARQFTPKPTNRKGDRVTDPIQTARETEREGAQALGIR